MASCDLRTKFFTALSLPLSCTHTRSHARTHKHSYPHSLTHTFYGLCVAVTIKRDKVEVNIRVYARFILSALLRSL